MADGEAQQLFQILLVKEKYWWLHSISEYDGNGSKWRLLLHPHIIKRIEGHKIDKNLQQNTLPPLKKIFKPMISGLFDVYNLEQLVHYE
jgi:hypothetical protein